MKTHTMEHYPKPRPIPEDCQLYRQIEQIAEHFELSFNPAFKRELLAFAYEFEVEKYRRAEIRALCPYVPPFMIDEKTKQITPLGDHNGVSPCICNFKKEQLR